MRVVRIVYLQSLEATFADIGQILKINLNKSESELAKASGLWVFLVKDMCVFAL